MTSNIAGKSIGSAIKSLLNSEYKFLGGDKVQEMFVNDILSHVSLKLSGSIGLGKNILKLFKKSLETHQASRFVFRKL